MNILHNPWGFWQEPPYAIPPILVPIFVVDSESTKIETMIGTKIKTTPVWKDPLEDGFSRARRHGNVSCMTLVPNRHQPHAAGPRGNNQARGVLFDFDGTLFDASEAIIHAFNATLKATGLPEWPIERILSHIGYPLVEMFPLADPQASRQKIERMIETYRAIFLPLSVSLTRPLPGLESCLASLTGSGYRLGIVTNRGGPGARHMLEGFGLLDVFGAIIGVDDVEKPKPDPEPVCMALATLEVRHTNAVLVGDTPVDMQAAVAAGVSGIGVLTGSSRAEPLWQAGASAVIPDLTHLPVLLEKHFLV